MEELEHRIQQIVKNNTAGSVEVLDEVIRALEGLLKEKEDFNNQELLSVLKALSQKRPEFLALSHFVNELTNTIEKSSPLSFWLKEYGQKWVNVNRTVSEQAIKLIDFENKTLLLHSNSSTIKALLALLSEQKVVLQVLQTISHPEEEGRLQGVYLEKLGFQVELLDEGDSDKWIPQIDIALFGADAIYEDAFLNKIGTRLIAANCKEQEKPVYVLADSRKRLAVHSSQSKTGTFRHYFELCENGLVTDFVFESGIS